jgi:CheY-like chemotaxis protein
MAEDDADDRLLTRQAFAEARFASRLVCVDDGQELLDYLQHKGNFAAEGASPRPGIILLDLNMPRMDGREALRRIKSDPESRRIPVIVLTTSKAEEDIFRSYDLGASGFVTKPVTFESLVEAVRVIGQYWFQLVELPRDTVRDSGPRAVRDSGPTGGGAGRD